MIFGMREIKYRGKRISNGNWIFGDLITSMSKDEVGSWIKPKYSIIIPVEEETVGEFIGLHDKDNTPIYEGDIVQSFTNWGDFGKVGVVEFSNGRFRLNVNGIWSKYKDFVDEEEWDDMGARMKVKYTYKVIGNVYDNLELAKKVG